MCRAEQSQCVVSSMEASGPGLAGSSEMPPYKVFSKQSPLLAYAFAKLLLIARKVHISVRGLMVKLWSFVLV